MAPAKKDKLKDGVDGAKNVASDATDQAEKISDSKWFERAARGGYIANGVIHLVLGFIAWNLAFGSDDENADQSGAVRAIADQPFGIVLIWFCFIGAGALGLFHLLNGILGLAGRMHHGDKKEQAKEIVKDLGKAVAFLAVSGTCMTFAFGGDSDSGESAKTFTTIMMGNPFGMFVLYLVGAGLIIGGGFYVYKGVSKKFEEDLKHTSRKEISKALTVTGMIGHAAKGLVLAAVGLLFVVATFNNDPEESTGIDGALRGILDQPFGQPALAAIGVGLILFAIYLFLRSRYQRMD